MSRAEVRRGLDSLVHEFPVILVCAPAGYGKTLLLADWVESTGGADKIWVSLDVDDNNADRFWAAVVSAVRRHALGLEAGELNRLPMPGTSDTAGFLAEVIDALAELPAVTHLVLDDVHEVFSKETLHGIATLIHHQPANLRIVLSSRADPPLPLARLRLEGRLAELRASELRFSQQDATTLMHKAGVPLTDDQVCQLIKQTDGWAAGLRLAAQSLRDVADRDAFLADFASNDRAIADYLVSEVLTRLPTETREFLQTVSVCDEVTPILAAVLSGRDDAGAILAALERESALMLGVGPDRQWYRMHPLLHSYLQADLARQRPERTSELHAAAATWFAAHEQPGKAFDHAARTSGSAASVALLRRYAVPLLMTGDSRTVRRALTKAGAPAVSRDPWLALVSALAHVQTAELDQAVADLRHSRRAWPSDPDGGLQSLSRLMAATHALACGRPEPAEPIDWRDLVAAQEGSDLEAWARLGLGWTLLRAGERQVALGELELAERLAREQGFDYLVVHILAALGVLSGLEGAFSGMEAACSEAVAIADIHGWRNVPGLAIDHALIGLAGLMRLDPVLGGRRHVRDLQRGALVRRDRGEDLLYDGGAGVGTRSPPAARAPASTGPPLPPCPRCPLCAGSTGRTLRRPGRRTMRRDHIRPEDVLVLEPVDRRRPVTDGPYLQVTARLVVDRLGQQLCASARSDDRDGQMVRRGVREGTQIRQAHPDAHQQRGDQVRQDVTQPGGAAGERADGGRRAPLRWSGRRTVLMGQAFSASVSSPGQLSPPVAGTSSWLIQLLIHVVLYNYLYERQPVAHRDDSVETIQQEMTAFARRARAAAARMHPELSLVSYTLLAHLDDQQGCRATDLAAHYFLDKSTVSRQIAALEKLGFVERRVDPEDHRVQVLHPTERAPRYSPTSPPAAARRSTSGWPTGTRTTSTASPRTCCATTPPRNGWDKAPPTQRHSPR